MKITELLSKNTILLDIKGTEKASTIDQLVDVLLKADKISDRDDFKAAIVKREEQSTTGIGDGIAIPHAKTKAVKEAAIVFGKSSNGVHYESLDGKPAHLFFMIAAPDGANNTHLEALARLSGLLMKVEVRYELLMATTPEDVLNTINRYDKEEKEAPSTESKKHTVVAVTGCPTGIAHTYMAADSLKAKAKEMGVDIKVETNGSGGAKNVLTKAEIDAEDELYSEKGVGIKVIYVSDVDYDKISSYYFYERGSEKVLDFALEEDEEELVLTYCRQHREGV